MSIHRTDAELQHVNGATWGPATLGSIGPVGEPNVEELIGSEFSRAQDGPTMQALLAEICLCLTEALPRAESAGVVIFTPERRTLGRPAGPLVSAEVIGMAPVAAALVKVETQLDEGPALSACRSNALVASGHLQSDDRWSRFGPAVGHLQINSAVSVPLPAPADDTAAALAVYSQHEDAFSPRAVNLIAALGGAAASVLVSANMRERAGRALKAAELSRIVNQAVGVLMSQNCTEEQARSRLARMSRNGNQDLATSARMIVEEARNEVPVSYIASRPT